MRLPELPLRRATATHILSTWRQVDYLQAQIDGSVRSPFYRNIAASLAVTGDPKSVNDENANAVLSLCHDCLHPHIHSLSTCGRQSVGE